MQEKPLYNSNGTQIGRIVTDSQGNSVAYDRNGSQIGRHSSNSDTTYNRNGSAIGTGDFLSALITLFGK